MPSKPKSVLRRRGRDRISVMAEILGIASDGANKSQIMYRANLSFRNLHEYLSLLSGMGLLKNLKIEGKEIYKTTSKGFIYLQNFNTLHELLKIESERSAPTKTTQKTTPKITSLESEIKNLKGRVEKLETRILRSGICPDCGRGILPDFRLCPYCGRNLLTSGESTKVRNQDV